MDLRKFFTTALILCLAAGLLPACASAPNPLLESTEGDTFTIRINEDPETLDNVRTTSGAAEAVMANTFLERLIFIDSDNVMHGWLAESWVVSPDQKEVTFKLRQGKKFTDGTDFNAAAVKHHFDRIMDRANASPSLAYIGPLQEVVVVDDYTVRLVFSDVYAGLWNVLNYGYFGFNSPAAVEKWGDEYGRHPVGTGPLMLAEWIPGSKITFVRNPDFVQVRADALNQGPAKLGKMEFVVIPEDGTAMAALMTGEVQASLLNPETLLQVQNDERFNITINKNSNHLVYLEYNYRHPPFNDPLFRQAVGHAIDRDSIIQSSRDGYATAAYSPLAVGIIGFDPQVAEQYATLYDPQKARQLLAQAGWTDTNGDGTIDKDGQEARFELRGYSGYVYYNRTLEVIQANLKDVGIEVEIVQSDWGAFYPSLLEDDWDIAGIGWSWGDMDVLKVLFRSPGHRGQIPPDPELDAVLDSIDTTMDPDQRLAIASQAQKMLMERYLVTPIQSGWGMYAIQKNLMDFHFDHYGYLLVGDLWFQK